PGLGGAINVLLLTAACRASPQELLEAAVLDGAGTWQVLRSIVWPSVRGMKRVWAISALIDGRFAILVLPFSLYTPAKYTLTVGMEYLNSNFGSDPRVVAAGIMIALVPIIVFFAVFQKFFFQGVEDGAVKG